MAQVVGAISMSLDGFIAGPNDGRGNGLGDGGEPLHDWVMNGDPRGMELLEEGMGATGSMLMGRKSYDVAHEAWNEREMFPIPVFVLTHRPADDYASGATSYYFVAEGFEAGLERAREAAGDRVVALHGGTAIAQAVQAGAIDELIIMLAPLLLGGGSPLFGTLGIDATKLEQTEATMTPHTTYLRYRF